MLLNTKDFSSYVNVVRGLTVLAIALTLTSCKRPDPRERGRAILHMALRTRVGTLDPLRCTSQYDAVVDGAIFEPLFEYDYRARPYRLVPNLVEAMPEVSDDRLTYTFTLKRNVFFHDDPAFEGGRGREMNAADVIYSIKRMADKSAQPAGWWIYNDRIVGFDAFQRAAWERPLDQPFDADLPVEGLEILDSHRFRIRLIRPFPQLLNVLAMCYAAVVPREAVSKYGSGIGQHPVGSGPFRLRELTPGTRVVLDRHERYRDRSALDGIVMHVFEQDQPMWLKWRVGDLDFIQVPTEYFDSAFDEAGALRESFAREGIGYSKTPKLDFVFRGFNMDDPVTGGFDRGKLVRQAISLAFDGTELADAFYNNTSIIYDGPIPPGLDGYSADRVSKYRGPDVERAKALLVQAGYPQGRGLEPIEYHTNRGGNSLEQAELIARQLRRIGVRLHVNAHSFPELDALLKKGKAQMFNYAWGSDYPDAENNLALFYGPNRSPGSNYFNYRNPEYDTLYARARTLLPSPERTELYQRMRDLVIEDCPAIGGFARTRFYVWGKRVHDLVPDETWTTWIKHVRVDADR
jgi:ABC-type transport system substrate-binding protein